MRKHLILLLLMSLKLMTYGQTLPDIDVSELLPPPIQAQALHYWFDGDSKNTITVDGLTGTYSLDVSALSDGIHTLYYQVKAEDGMNYGIAAQVFLKMPELEMPSLDEGVAASTIQYWFDGNTDIIETVNGQTDVYFLDVSSLPEGMHSFYCQIIGVDGQRYGLASQVFLKMADIEAPTIDEGIAASNLQYWFDTDSENVQTANGLTGVYALDVSSLEDGIHTLYYQIIGEDGQRYGLASQVFLKMPELEIPELSSSVVASELRYWIDDDTENIQIVNGLTGAYVLDMSTLVDGMHTLHYQVMGEDGHRYGLASQMFLKMPEIDTPELSSSVAASELRYWIDDDTENMQIVKGLSGAYVLDMSTLVDGVHTLHYQIMGEDGQRYGLTSQVFVKMTDTFEEMANITKDSVLGRVDENGITQYKYWLNENAATMQTVTLDEMSSPFTLLTLLPIKGDSIRSSDFLFEMKSGKPMLYAKDDFHIRFIDAAGYWVDAGKPFIDYGTSREVIPEQVLEGFTCNGSMQKPAFNEIHWYAFEAAPGDTAAFKLSQPATVQVFAPSGEEVFKTSESASVKWGGIHTWEDGTYYLAVHDVTGSQSTMKLEYMHMDKYDVVDWDVHRVGNGGCSTITFKGNGFRDLYGVDLVIAPGDTIHSAYVSHDSDAETAVTFDFTDATLGDYNAVFHFTEEDKPVANVVTVEEAVDIELATDVSFPSSFLRGTSTTYTIKITNKGNMTAYNVPIYSYLMNKNQEDGISHIKFEGLGLASLLDIVDLDSLSLEDRMEIQEVVEELGDEHYFQLIRAKNEETSGDSIWVRCGYFFTNIAPFETKTLRLIVTASETVWAYISVPTDWSVFSETKDSIAPRALLAPQKAKLKEGFCCYHEKIECFLDMSSLVADFIELISLGAAAFTDGATLPAAVIAKWTGCATSSLSSLTSISATFFCDTDKSFMEKLKEQGAMNTLSVLATVLSCQPGEIKALKMGAKFIKETLKNWKTLVKGGIKWGDNGSGFFQCRSNPQNVPNCPPDPPHGGDSNPQPPTDPNDIFGYLSEAGSMFIADSVARVNYTIEFENDTTFATAAAHTIVIKDTLDNKVFDLTRFMPTGIRIGSREAFLDEADVVTKNNVTSFVKTIDMRPEINAIAQVDGTFNQKNGIAQWTLQSLDPMTMEPTDDLMQGILPVNYNGTSGIGEVMFEVGVKQGKADGTQIKNRAGIVFDYEEAILTPTWTNIVDAIAPSSTIDGFEVVNDTILHIKVDGYDNRSGIWKYELHTQYGENAPWWKLGESDSASFDFRFYDDVDYGFCVLATDSAGNVEKKVIQRERSFKAHEGDYEDSIIDVLETTSGTEDSYDISGRKVGRKAKDVIIRKSNDVSRKVLIK